MNKPLLYTFLFALISCGTKEKKSSSAYFAGEIVNPTSDYVVLYKDEVVIDSAKLNQDNRFSITLDSVAEGLYHFNHSPELQYVYLEQGDSLMIRLNTKDFDESLIFSGTGDEINNFLLELFLSTEDEPNKILPLYSLEPSEFCKKIDSLRSIKFKLLNELSKEAQLSKNALEIATASIDYHYYTYKERYPFWNRIRNAKKEITTVPEHFYTYRKDLEYDNNKLTYLRPYYNFMKNHFDNLSYMSCKDGCLENHHSIVKNKLHFNQHKLQLINDLVTEKGLRDNLFRNVAMDYLINAHEGDENNKIFINDFRKLAQNNKHHKEIELLYQGVINLQPSSKLPNISVINAEGISVTLQEIADKEKNAVFYFWTDAQRMHFEGIKKRVSQLAVSKPEYTFIGINCNTDPARWQYVLNTSNLDTSKQYRSDDFENLKNALVLKSLNKGIITKDGVIIDAFADIYSSF
ncbi:hypothetical protein SAMN04487911_1107 [Arenibacter nanhaiticus]|uniref:Transaldolase n=1 Tax=Arenibacter nanhaiticus TaxID=558155 RepID=A0A1M6G3A6_9FLAO|nr:transaldolase [Arenibacter nanhaiticus]SHJ04307.1 hypothetical protein SAMN04487911_1107 [Arenibacter nanhaiticus]